MSNNYYNHTGYPTNSQDAQAVDVRSEFLAIQAMADKLPALSGNALKLVQVNAGATGLTALPLDSGVWAPTFTFQTPGNQTFVYSTQDGYYVRMGPLMLIAFRLVFSTFTFTTASGNAKITGLPRNPTAVNNAQATMAIYGSGITKAGYTQVLGIITPVTAIQLMARGSGVAESPITAADMPTGGAVTISGSTIYRTDDL